MSPRRPLTRRGFLKGSSGAVAGVAAAMLLGSRTARGYGEAPSAADGIMLPKELQVRNVLEVYLLGGISQYESFYTIEEHGAQNAQGWHLHLESGELETALSDCGLTMAQMLEEFDEDAEGQLVKLGPFASPLHGKSRILDRTRLLVSAHDALPHEVAIPLALTGRPLSSVSMAGLGTHVQRYYLQQQGVLQAPASYVLMPSTDIANELGRAAFATGTHPAPARPLPLRVDRSQELLELLSRPSLAGRQSAFDDLVAVQYERFGSRLVHETTGPVRAPTFDDARAAAEAVRNSDKLAEVLDPSLLAASSAVSCGTTINEDTTGMSMRLAAHLLTNDDDDTAARYVCVVDGGAVDTPDAGGYDTHANNCPTQARNLTRVLSELEAVIRGPDDPPDARKIDLDDTLVIINTEFGRTPQGEGNGGRGHWPFSFPVLMIGGPVTKRGIYGVTGSDFRAKTAITPAEHRIAVLLAMGIWPFEQDSYNVSDVDAGQAGNEENSVALVLEKVFGV